MERIPFHVPTVEERDIEAVLAVLRSGWMTTGPYNRRFEEEFAAYLGGGLHAVAVNSCTAAMHLAVEAVGLGPGDLALCPILTFTATAEVLRYVGADPLFVDVDPQSMAMEAAEARRVLEALDAAERKRVKAILPVHYGGRPCDMEGFQELADEFQLRILDDAAHALPAKRNGRWIGQFGDVTSFSFYATKTLCTGEGGMAVTRDEELARRMRTMRLHGIDKDVFDRYRDEKPSWYYEVVAPGFKYNLMDAAAAMGSEQLPRVEAFRRARAAIRDRYDRAFADHPLLVLPPDADAGDLHAWHLYVLRVRGGRERRDRLIADLAAAGIGTSVHFIPLHMQPYWRDRYGLRREDFARADALFEQIVSLPIYPALSEDQIERVCTTLLASLPEA